MEIAELCEIIDLPEEMRSRVLAAAGEVRPNALLCDIRTAGAEFERLKAELGDDADGVRMLATQLMTAAEISHVEYERLGISENIFADTMQCFTRFVGEHRKSFGSYGFDRGFWTYRQLALTLLRTGSLEYEFLDGERTTHIHIPSGADISLPACKASLDKLKNLTARAFPRRTGYALRLDSWLLSPGLAALLPEGSRIKLFQSCFLIDSVDENATDYKQWLFGRTDLPTNALPETTSLQRKVKQYLLKGGNIGSAAGTLISFDRH